MIDARSWSSENSQIRGQCYLAAGGGAGTDGAAGVPGAGGGEPAAASLGEYEVVGAIAGPDVVVAPPYEPPYDPPTLQVEQPAAGAAYEAPHPVLQLDAGAQELVVAQQPPP